MSTPHTGRRAATASSRRPSPTSLLAVLLPVATVVPLLLVGPAPDPEGTRPPSDVPLSRTTLVCPPPEGQSTVGVAHLDPDVGGRLQQTVPTDGALELRPGAVTTLDGPAAAGPVALVAEGELAPGPVGGRWDGAGPVACTRPEPDAWFTGLAAGPERSSVIHLVNPDNGPAVADLTVSGPSGPIEATQLRGVRVPGRDSLTLDLGELVPTRDDLAVHVQVERGRLGVDAVDVEDPVGGGPVTRVRVASQAEPLEQSWLLGLEPGDGEPVLHVANPGDDFVRVSLRVVTDRSEFAPAGFEELQVAAGAVGTVPLDDVLQGGAVEGAVGVRLDASAPVTATLRGVRSGDAVAQVASTPVTALTGAVLPEGPKRLVLAGADTLGTARVSVRDADGRVLERRRIEVDPSRGAVVDLPAAGRVVVVEVAGTGVSAAVTVESPRAGVVPLVEVPLTGQAAEVRPALP
jgi:hypothetical protein